MQHFTPNQLKDYLATAKTAPLLLDVREPWEFDVCHIQGSELIPMAQVPTQAPRLNPDQETVVICHHGIRSRQVAYFLEHLGFKHVINLDGGVEAWASDVAPDMQRY